MASQLPPAIVQFSDASGVPLAGGFVFYYIPNTTTVKQVWGDAAQTVLLTNPIVLNAAGQPQNGTSQTGVFGTGTYRQIVQDSNGNQIWDAPTTDPNSAPGDASIAGNLTVSGTSTFTGAGYFSSTLGVVDTFTAAGNATVGGNLGVIGSLSCNANASVAETLNVFGGLGVGGSANVVGPTSLAGGLAVSGVVLSGTAGGYALTSSGVTPFSGTITVSATFASACSSGTFYATSDARLKTDVTDITPSDGERFVNTARPVIGLKEGAPFAGFIAQEELAAGRSVVLIPRPGMVERTEANGVLSPADQVMLINESERIPFLTAALKAVFARLDELEKKEMP